MLVTRYDELTTLCLLSCSEPDFTDVPLREDQREYLCKVADG